MKKFLVVAVIFIIVQLALQGLVPHGAEGDHHGTPWGVIINQTINFTLVIVFLYFVAGKAISQHFSARKEGFNDLVKRAESAREEAEKSHREIKERLAKLESSATQNLEQAKSEAEELKQKIVSEAQVLSDRLKIEAKNTAQYELERAVNELRNEVLNTAIESAHKNLKEKVGDPDQKRLQGEFLEKIQVVR